MGPTHIFACVCQMLSRNLTIFGTHQRLFMTNSGMQKLNNIIHHDGTTEMNSNNLLLQQDVAPSHTAKHHQIPAEPKVTFIEAAMWPANSPDLNLVDLQCVAPCSSKCIVMTV